MKVIITIKRLTEYSSIVEMDEQTFNQINKQLLGNRVDIRSSERDLNRRINTKDWQDDDFHSLETFEEFIPKTTPTLDTYA